MNESFFVKMVSLVTIVLVIVVEVLSVFYNFIIDVMLFFELISFQLIDFVCLLGYIKGYEERNLFYKIFLCFTIFSQNLWSRTFVLILVLKTKTRDNIRVIDLDPYKQLFINNLFVIFQ